MSEVDRTISEAARETPVLGTYDVVVLGGGPSGIAAAAAAAMHGCETLLVERYGFLGGMGTAAGVSNFFGLYANVYGEIEQVVHGLCDELLARMDRLGGLSAPHDVFGKTRSRAYDTAVYKCAADDLLRAKGAQTLFHALAVGAQRSPDGAVTALIVETKSGRRAIRGRMFIDCSGDADLASWAGVPFALGRTPDELLYPSMTFRVNAVDAKAAGQAWRTIRARMAAAVERGICLPGTHAVLRPQPNPLEWRVIVTRLKNSAGGPVDGTDAIQLASAEIEGRRQILAFFQFLQDEVPGFKDAYIVDIPPQVGIRESRRIIGRYVLSKDDVMACRRFEDAIGMAGLPVDNHIAGSLDWTWPDVATCPGTFDLPLRMLVPEGVSNLLVAGRCASTTHEAQSATRPSGPCFAMGQAAGTAAFVSLDRRMAPRAIPTTRLRDLLTTDGVRLHRKQARDEAYALEQVQ